MVPHRSESRYWNPSYWRQDFLSSLVVFLVALPLCMGIALASGAPVATGLVTGIVGGLVVGMLGGAPLQVSGPAAGLTVICADVIREHGMPVLGIMVLIAGVLQLTAGIFRLGQWFRAVSPAVIRGMLSGIGVLILTSQFHVMVDDRPRESGVQNMLALPESLVKGLPLPTWEAAPARRARIELLQTFGMVHQRQSDIRRAVERTILADSTEARREVEAEQLDDFVEWQESVVGDLRAAIQQFEASPIAAKNGDRAVKLWRAVTDAEEAMRKALADLGEPRVARAEETQAEATQALGDVLEALKNHDWAAKVGLLCIGVILVWQTVARGALKLIPAPLLAVVIATSLAWSLSLPVLYVEVPDDLRDGLTFPSWTVFREVPLREILVGGIMIAVIASAETLLCATAVDQMHNGPRTRYDQELGAQGVGNLICGFLGVLPMTGVIVRSAANVQSGAKTRLSAILHGIWLLVFVLALAWLLRLIPVAALAGILVYTGFKLINIRGFFELWEESRSEAMIFLATVTVIVVEDLLVGVVTGVVLSAIKLLITFSRLHIDLTEVPTPEGRQRVTMAMSGAATFLRLPLMAAKLEEVPRGAELHVDLENLTYIDHACLELLMNWAKQHQQMGANLVVDWESLHARFRAENGTNRSRVEVRASSTRPQVDSVA